MRASVLTAFEHQTLKIGDDQGHGGELSLAEAQRLHSLAKVRPGLCTFGHRSVKLAQFTGLVNLGERILEVLPKTGELSDASASRGTLLRLLGLADELPLFADAGVGHDLQRQTLLDVFVRAFLGSVSNLVRAGLLRRYRTEEEDLGVVRGRLVLKRQATVLALRPDRLACRFDDLTVDNPWNQVLKAALAAVRPWTRSVPAHRLWLELVSAFDDVSTVRDAVALHAGLRVDRQARHYAAAFSWAGWILRLLSPSLRGGAREAPELLFDMNRLFEIAVAALLRRRAAARGVQLSVQDTGLHLSPGEEMDGPGYFRLRPDIVLRAGASVLVVADTKWTLVERDCDGRIAPSDAHVYQLNAYAGVYPCDEVVLIYPWHRALEGAHPTIYRLPPTASREPMLHVVCVDVGDEAMPFRMVRADSQLGRFV